MDELNPEIVAENAAKEINLQFPEIPIEQARKIAEIVLDGELEEMARQGLAFAA